MKGLASFFASIDTPGGHMCFMASIIFCGIAAHLWIPSDQLIHDVVVGATGVLFGVMKGQNGSKMRLEPKTDTPIGGSVVTTEKRATETETKTEEIGQ